MDTAERRPGQVKRSGSQADQDAEKIFGEILLDVKRAAAVLGVKPTTIRKWIQDDDLLAIRLGKEYRISEQALRDFKDERERQHRRRIEDKRADQERQSELTRRRERDR